MFTFDAPVYQQMLLDRYVGPQRIELGAISCKKGVGVLGFGLWFLGFWFWVWGLGFGVWGLQALTHDAERVPGPSIDVDEIDERST